MILCETFRSWVFVLRAWAGHEAASARAESGHGVSTAMAVPQVRRPHVPNAVLSAPAVRRGVSVGLLRNLVRDAGRRALVASTRVASLKS